MGQLPSARVQPSRPFLHTGVDYCGPFNIKANKRRKCPLMKVYIAVFVCFSSKAMHLELVEDMTTPTFLNALHRFTARRGKPRKIYSDNGSNFVSANRELKINHFTIQGDKTQLSDTLTSEGIEWSFIPPAAPHFGGLWESGVRQVKFHLKRTITSTHTLTFPEFNTILTQIEACVNSRPLIPLSSDPSDLQPLTPSHFLIGEPLTNIPEPNLSILPTNRLSSYQNLRCLFQKFWKQWSTQYLNQLQERSKWRKPQPNLQLGTLVIIKETNTAPMTWKLGRIIKTHAGTDGLIRVATVRTANGEFDRPITKLCPLPLDDTSN